MKTELSRIIDEQKYQEDREGHETKCRRLARSMADDKEHENRLYDILVNQRFLPAGRIQAAMGAKRQTTAFNCFVSGVIEDDFDSIFDKVKEAGQTMRRGGGIGYDFSTLRPRGDIIRSLNSTASGPISFMDVYDSACATVLSAGHRRGAQMGVLRVDHPDIEAFIEAKRNSNKLTNFNISVGITDDFMYAVLEDDNFDLKFNNKVYKTVRAVELWDRIMQSTWDWAEPGVLFLDTINRKNNLHAIEKITATNPCGEQPLPPYGACLLGSFNLPAYIYRDITGWRFNYGVFQQDVAFVVRAMDNVIDRTIYPLPEQEAEAKAKRRMGLGVTGLANASEILGFKYATEESKEFISEVMTLLRDRAYLASVDLAQEKGPFPLFNSDTFGGTFFNTLPSDIQSHIRRYGLRNSHLLSIAPTGTISLVADNVSSGIEPPFSLEYYRDVYLETGEKIKFKVEDYAKKFYGINSTTADDMSASDHVDILNLVSSYVDSACSKTCNVGDNVSFNEFKEIYMRAWKGGASGCTTFRAAGKRFGVLTKVEGVPEEGAACYIDPTTGVRECS